MKNLLVASLFSLAPVVGQATPLDDIASAAQQLAAASNYSWSTAAFASTGVTYGFGPTTGQAEKGGYAVTTVETRNGKSYTVRKGDAFIFSDGSGAWMTIQDLYPELAKSGSDAGRGSGGGPGGAGILPAEEVTALAASVKQLKVADGVIFGNLSDQAVSQRLAYPGGPAPKNATGTVKFWLKDHALAKYEVRVKGDVTGRDGAARFIDRTATTEITKIGTTQVFVPDGAKNKISPN